MQVNILFLEGVPALAPAQRDEARRYLTLVDALYDYGATLCCSVAAPPAELFLPLLAAAKVGSLAARLAGPSSSVALQRAATRHRLLQVPHRGRSKCLDVHMPINH
jgi:predicted ATPase